MSRRRPDKVKSSAYQNIYFLCFNLQKYLLTPLTCSGIDFDKRSLWTLNLTVYSVTNKNQSAYCYIWDETIDGREGNEITLCIRQLLLSLHEDVVTLEIINQKFLEPCFTHIEADSIHAAIENTKKNKTTKIDTPRDWANLIGLKDFPNFIKLLHGCYVHRKYNILGQSVPWLKIQLLQYRSDSPGNVFYKVSFSLQEEFKTFNPTRRGRHPVNHTNSHDTYTIVSRKSQRPAVINAFYTSTDTSHSGIPVQVYPPFAAIWEPPAPAPRAQSFYSYSGHIGSVLLALAFQSRDTLRMLPFLEPPSYQNDEHHAQPFYAHGSHLEPEHSDLLFQCRCTLCMLPFWNLLIYHSTTKTTMLEHS
ncbi:hypothetical protein PR048_005222 [Dryococelus australis]|uniref:Uncharacterized protein n=1 Tax=Dryococelus australis TaxID=614101 RepID=A0ABQ9I8H6_9NEOP|nr:hypothetical protein PR048_005222 [Dryococelus australis]